MNPTTTTTTLLLTAMISPLALAVDTPDWTHSRLATDYVQVIPAANGGVIAMGETTSQDSISDSDVYVTQLNADGTEAWSHQWQGNISDPDYSIRTDRFVDAVARPDGGVAVLGLYRDADAAGNASGRLAVKQIDGNGQLVASTDLDWTNLSYWALSGIHLGAGSNGQIIVARSDYASSMNAGLVSLDADGQVNWSVDLHDTITEGGIQVLDLVMSADGRSMICGEVQHFGNPQGMLAASFDNAGNLEWSQIFETPITYGFQKGHAAVDAAGNLHVCGDLVNLDFDSDLHAAKIDPAGTVLWQYTLQESQTSFFPCGIEVAANGNVYIGTSLHLPDGNNSFDGGFRIVGLDAMGAPLWNSENKVYSDIFSIAANGLAVAPDGRINIVGSGWVGVQDSAQMILTWNPDGTFKNMDLWNEDTSHEAALDSCYDANGDLYVSGQGAYINHRYTGTVRHFPETSCPGDLNRDGQVSVGDLLNLLAAFGSNDLTADINNDGTVDISDLLTLLGNWDGCNA